MKKKNNSGFTLVELIVVIALLTFMMGAILKLMDPIRNVYHDTLDTVNTKTTGETMISYVEDKVRYSTNVLVLKNYVGVPQISQVPGTSNVKVGSSKFTYSNVMIVDNTNIRGYALSDYAGDSASKYARKGCKGAIYEIKNLGDSSYIDISKATTGTLGEDIYGDYTHDIDLDVIPDADDPTMQYLKLDVLSSPMEYDGSTYVKSDENTFKADRSFDLVNINLSEKMNRTDAFAVDDIASKGGCLDFEADSSLYSEIPQVTATPSGLTSYQEKFYDTSNPNNKYTYLFFVVNRADAEECVVSLIYDPNDPDSSYAGTSYPRTFKVSPGDTLDSAAITTLKSLPSRSHMDGPFFYDGNGQIDLDTYTFMTSTLLRIVYLDNGSSTLHDVNFYMPDGTTLITTKQVYNDSVVGNILPDLPAGTYDENKQYVEWVEMSTGQSASTYMIHADAPSPTDPVPKLTVNYKPIIHDKCLVRFKENGWIDPANDQYVKPGEIAGEPSITVTPPADKVFDNWYYNGEKRENCAISDNPTVFEAKFKDKPAAINGWTMNAAITNNGTQDNVWTGSANVTCLRYSFLLTFNNSTAGAEARHLSVKLKLSEPSNVVNIYNVSISGNGTSEITISPTLWNPIQDNGTHSLNNADFYFTNTNTVVESVELVSIS